MKLKQARPYEFVKCGTLSGWKLKMYLFYAYNLTLMNRVKRLSNINGGYENTVVAVIRPVILFTWLIPYNGKFYPVAITVLHLSRSRFMECSSSSAITL